MLTADNKPIMRTEEWQPARQWCAAQKPPMSYNHWMNKFRSAMETKGEATKRLYEEYPGSGPHTGWHIKASVTAEGLRTWSHKPRCPK